MTNSPLLQVSDLALAAALIVLGFPVRELEKISYRKVWFIFDRSEELEAAIDLYWADRLEVNPKTYFDAIKHLKTRIYSEA